MKLNVNVPLFRIVSWLAFLGLYLLMVGKTDPSEIGAGAVAATIALFLVRLLRQKFKRPLLIKARWLLLLWRVPVAMVWESLQLLVALVRQLAGKGVDGSLIEHAYEIPEDEHAPARHAYMTFGVCITPNSYLIYYDRDAKRALIHQLVGEKISTVDRLFVELP